ncbi:hypothetical protein [Streptomyces sp. 2A115]
MTAETTEEFQVVHGTFYRRIPTLHLATEPDRIRSSTTDRSTGSTSCR